MDPTQLKSLIQGAYQTPEEAEWLAKTVSSLRPKNILEIGVAEGGVSRLFCHIVGNEGRVVGLDITDALVAEDVKRSQNYTLIVGDSHEAAVRERVRQICDQYDVLLIDGDHSADGVLRDTEDYLPLVRDGGLILWHGVRLEPDHGIKGVWYKNLRRRLLGASEIYAHAYNNGLGAWFKTNVTVDDALESARLLISQSRIEDAEKFLEMVARTDPYQRALWPLVADAALARNDIDTSCLALARALVICPGDGHLVARASEALAVTMHEPLRESLEIYSSEPEPIPGSLTLRRVRLAKTLALPDRAIDALKIGLQLAPRDLTLATDLVDMLRDNSATQKEIMDVVLDLFVAFSDDARLHQAFEGRIGQILSANFQLQKYSWVPEFIVRLLEVRPSFEAATIRFFAALDDNGPRFKLLMEAVQPYVDRLPGLARWIAAANGLTPIDRDIAQIEQHGMAAMKAAELNAAISLWKPIQRVSTLALKGMASCGLYFRGVGHSIHTFPGLEALQRLVQQLPDDADVWLTVVLAYLDAPTSEIGDGSELHSIISNLLRLDPTNIRGLYAAGMLSQHVGRLRDAEAAYRRVLELDPTHVMAQLRLHSLGFSYPRRFEAASVVEVDLNTHTPPMLQRGGAIILRNALPRDLIESMTGELRAHLVKMYSARCIESPAFNSAPATLRAKLSAVIAAEIVRRIHPQVSAYGAKGWRPSIHNKWHFQMHGKHQTDGIPLHSDNPVACMADDWTTFWIPFDKCGPGIAPSLKIFEARLTEPLVIAEGKTGVMNEVDHQVALNFFDGHWQPTSFEPGDLLVFDRYLPHSTFSEKDMPGDRVSCDIRFNCGPAAFGKTIAGD